MTDAERFLEALAAGIEPEERLILCSFRGDPDEVKLTAWRPRPWAPGRELPFGPRDNAYVTVASFGRGADHSHRRRANCFAAGMALMVDDVGTKVPHGVVEKLAPSARIETSRGNEQWWYFFDRPLRDRERFDALIAGFIAGPLAGKDSGMASVTRVARLPGFLNAKAKCRTAEEPDGFRTRLLDLDAARRYAVEEIAAAFEIDAEPRRRAPAFVDDDARRVRVEMFWLVKGLLAQGGLLKRADPDLGGWTEIECPWRGDHTAGADTGAAIREPSEENGFYGGFKCHHGHCADKNWRALTDLLAEDGWGALDETNNEGQDK